jgi:uncharacterized protein (TIGR02246 family)
MKNHLLRISLVFLLCLTFACWKKGQEAARRPGANAEADAAAVKALIDEWVQLYNAGDFDRLVSIFYADNAILISPDMPPRKGKEAILLVYQKDDELNKEYVDSSVTEDVRISGDLAVAWGTDTGTSTPRSGGEPLKYKVNWLMAFERQPDGVWKCVYEMWNENPLPEKPE